MNCQLMSSWTVNKLCICLVINGKRSSNTYKIIKKIINESAIETLCSYTKSVQFALLQLLYTGELSEIIILL